MTTLDNTTDSWADVGEDRTEPLLPVCGRDDCKRLIIPTDQFDLYPRELVMTCDDCFANFLVNLEISAKVKEKVEEWRRKMEVSGGIKSW